MNEDSPCSLPINAARPWLTVLTRVTNEHKQLKTRSTVSLRYTGRRWSDKLVVWFPGLVLAREVVLLSSMPVRRTPIRGYKLYSKHCARPSGESTSGWASSVCSASSCWLRRERNSSSSSVEPKRCVQDIACVHNH